MRRTGANRRCRARRSHLAAAMMRLALAAAITSAAMPSGAIAQERSASAATRPLRVFLDCVAGCDFDYLRTEMRWVAYVRDRSDADVHLLVTRQSTGAGGLEYTVELLGLDEFAGRSDTLRVALPPDATADEIRSRLTGTIQLGLVPYLVRTRGAAGVRVVVEDVPEGDRPVVRDPWNFWVFRVAASGELEEEERESEFDVDGRLSAQRITEQWKLGISANGSYDRNRFDVEDRVITSISESWSAGAVAVRSMGRHWGSGVQAVVSASTFANTRLAMRAAPAIEYSVFPYAEASRRQLVVQYSLGISSFDYREETIFDRLSETRPTQALVVGYDVRQPWGSADAELEAASFLDNTEQFRVEADGRLNLRLVRGLELVVGGRASLLRDQLSIVKRDATPEEILLQRRALLTDYRYAAFLGLSYTFGSIFNTVVNPRFGTGPGHILR